MGMGFDFRVGGQRRPHWGDFDSGLEWRSKWRSHPCGYLRKPLSRCAKALRHAFWSNGEKACVEKAHQSSGKDGMGVGGAYSVKS